MEKNHPYRPLVIGALVTMDLWLLNYIAAMSASSLGRDLGTLGDSFGMVNALFSSAAVAGAIYALILQQRESKHSAINQQVTSEMQALSAYTQCLSSLLNSAQQRASRAMKNWENNCETLLKHHNLYSASSHPDHVKLLKIDEENATMQEKAMHGWIDIEDTWRAELLNTLATFRSKFGVVLEIPDPSGSAPPSTSAAE
jgi:hypothetical protein